MKSIPAFRDLLDEHSPDYEAYEQLYKHLHANPELSCQEYQTAAAIAQKLRDLSPDLEVIEGIAGTGLIAIFRNGPGRTVMLRADMDALPVKEVTGLDYASQKKMKDASGHMQPVMHACGHDMHVTALLAAIYTLLSSRARWSGTLIFVFQPAEEAATGAMDMVEDGLYGKHGCPIPDVVLGQHVSWHKAGTVTTRPGPLMAGYDSMVIRVFGRGGHGSMPNTTIDPVVLASHIVVRLQTIVSREVPPGELAVVTVGSLHAGGNTDNIIGDEAVLRVSTRTLNSQARKLVVDAIERIVRAECQAARSPREPVFELPKSVPPTTNDATVTKTLSRSFDAHFGENNYFPLNQTIPGSEDFSTLATAIDRPYCFWFFGGHDPIDWDKRKEEGRLASVPVNHSPLFAPAIRPTLKTGTEALVVAALAMLSDVSV